MQTSFKSYNLQSLVDLLAEETEKYITISKTGNINEIDTQKSFIDSLVKEIDARKRRKLRGLNGPNN